jgi:hypothetical protein
MESLPDVRQRIGYRWELVRRNGQDLRFVEGMVRNDHQSCRAVPLDVELDPPECGDLDVEREAFLVGDRDAMIGDHDLCRRDRDVSLDALARAQPSGNWVLGIEHFSHVTSDLARRFRGQDPAPSISEG